MLTSSISKYNLNTVEPVSGKLYLIKEDTVVLSFYDELTDSINGIVVHAGDPSDSLGDIISFSEDKLVLREQSMEVVLRQ